MPTITIRAHGVSATRNQTVVNPVTGEIVTLTAFQPPERTATRGWTPNVRDATSNVFSRSILTPWKAFRRSSL